jgi:AcrR family transcriptional regulator
LLDAAQRVMGRVGVEGATIAMITEDADVAFGSFYNYFKSKEEVALAVFTERIEQIAKVTDSIREAVTDPALRISYVQHLLMREARSDPLWGWFLVRAGTSLDAIRRTFHDRAMKTLLEGSQLGRFTFASAEVVITITIASLYAVVRAMLEERIPEDSATSTVELLLRMYGIPAEEAAALARVPILSALPTPVAS